jgi:hypothetical protein
MASEASGDLAPLRTAVTGVFKAVYVRPADHAITSIEGYDQSAQQIEGGAYWIEPHLREEAIVLTEEEGAGRSILRQVPLHLPDGTLNTRTGVPE